MFLVPLALPSVRADWSTLSGWVRERAQEQSDGPDDLLGEWLDPPPSSTLRDVRIGGFGTELSAAARCP